MYATCTQRFGRRLCTFKHVAHATWHPPPEGGVSERLTSKRAREIHIRPVGTCHPRPQRVSGHPSTCCLDEPTDLKGRGPARLQQQKVRKWSRKPRTSRRENTRRGEVVGVRKNPIRPRRSQHTATPPRRPGGLAQSLAECVEEEGTRGLMPRPTKLRQHNRKRRAASNAQADSFENKRKENARVGKPKKPAPHLAYRPKSVPGGARAATAEKSSRVRCTGREVDRKECSQAAAEDQRARATREQTGRQARAARGEVVRRRTPIGNLHFNRGGPREE
jgi:hypothetical protein